MTHNTKECYRYNKDGNPVAVAALKPTDAKKPFKKGCNKQMSYLMATVESMKKGLKKAMKSKSASITTLMTRQAAAILIQNRKLGAMTRCV
jgi:hypothetical protein